MRVALTVLAMILGACGQIQPSNQAAADGTARIDAERLAEMPEGQRNAVFIRAIRDAGLDCQHVERSRAEPDHRGYPVWTAECAGGGRWTLVVTGTGAQILDTDAMRLIDETSNTAR